MTDDINTVICHHSVNRNKFAPRAEAPFEARFTLCEESRISHHSETMASN
jgi:hypothetical protein